MDDVITSEQVDSNNNQQNNHDLKNKVASGAFWRFAERILAQGVSFIVSIFLARILSPNDYGAVAIILIFVAIADVFLSSGFSIGLIKKKNLTEKDLSTIFYLNLIISLFLYAVIFVTSPLIEKAYNIEGLSWFLRIIALKLPISGLNTIQIAIVTRDMRFKAFFFATLGGTLTSAVVGILMAYNGCGAWSLIAQHLTNLVIDSIILYIIVRWRPKLMFSRETIRELSPFSLRNMGTDLVGTIFNYLAQFVVGIKYTTEDLAYYSKGQQLPTMISGTLTQTLTSVMFPAITKVSEDLEHVKRILRKSTRVLSLVLFPIMVGLAVVAEELVIFLYTDKWSGMTIYLQLMCLTGLFEIIGAFDITTLKGLGKTKTTLILEFIKKPLYLIAIVVSMFFGVLQIAVVATGFALLANIINSIALYKYARYSLLEKFIDILFPLIVSAIMGTAVYFMKYIPINNTALLFIKVGVGIVIYLLACIITRNKTFFELKGTIVGMIKKKRTN